ncbi:thioredoxin family protein [Pelagibacterium montanilacus]|uniref:thioredoxin family protein n=1 Tax=Pelagibacterium montanilacus TaxID=2185280 RepID=UPI000F8DD9F1|nr:thioredoxin family protein [Pelagibacterium montanilacus]
MATIVEQPRLDIPAPDFSLPATDGRIYTRAQIMRDKGAVIVFISNHCPYVKAITNRLIAAAQILKADGVGFAAICSNDSGSHPEDSFENMAVFAKARSFTFPYLHDESQETARAYEAVCTPDFFGLNSEGIIKYRGRLDEGRKEPLPQGARAELIEAMRLIARTGEGPGEQIPSMGCSIKWKCDEQDEA